jgi:cell shape-determining protein MreC
MAIAKLTREQQLERIIAAERKLAEKKAKLLSKLADLSAESKGMQELLKAVQSVADQNDVAVAEVIKAVAKLKRTGLKIEKATRKPRTPKDPNAPKRTRGPNKPKAAAKK